MSVVEHPDERVTYQDATLDDLAAILRTEEDCILNATEAVMAHAIKAGEALAKARALLPDGKAWAEWAEAQGVSRTRAHLYKRVYLNQDKLPRGITLTDADLFLRGVPGPAGSTARHPDDVKEEARQRRAEGQAYKVIAADLGASIGVVHRWVNGDSAAERRRREREAYERQERNRKITAAVRKAGQATAEAYAMAERLQDVIAQAERESDDREKRAHLKMAGTHYRRMRDEIVRALGVDA